MIRKIFIDMDGVLADFDAWKETMKELHPEVMEEKMAMWELIAQVDHFFLNLDPTPWAYEMMDYLRSLGVPLAILTALPRRLVIPQAEPDKQEWIASLIDPDLEFQIGPYAIDKQNFCEEGYVLVDDNKKNIDQWNARGGIGIYFTDLEDLKKEISKIL